MAAAAASSGPSLLSLICSNYHPELTTPEAANAYLTSHPEVRGLARPSSNPNAFTLTYRKPTGGITNTRFNIVQEGSPPIMLNRDDVARVVGTTSEDPTALGGGGRTRMRRTRRARRTRRR